MRTAGDTAKGHLHSQKDSRAQKCEECRRTKAKCPFYDRFHLAAAAAEEALVEAAMDGNRSLAAIFLSLGGRQGDHKEARAGGQHNHRLPDRGPRLLPSSILFPGVLLRTSR